jgi:TorA maturation chaperone TorD
MEATVARVEAPPPVQPEDAARADFYALLATLFHHAPEGRLLRTIAIAPAIENGNADLARAWSALVAAAGIVDEEAVAEEYEALFIGLGKARVSAYAGFYLGAGAENPRARIIRDLAALGLSRVEEATEPEDHFAGLFDAMRVLVAGGAGRPPAPIAEQRRFHEAHVKPGAGRFLAAVREAPESNFYRKVAALGEAFLAIENESFNLG